MSLFTVEFITNNEVVEVRATNKKEAIRVLMKFGFNTKDIYEIREIITVK